jgi:hypothetical protein
MKNVLMPVVTLITFVLVPWTNNCFAQAGTYIGIKAGISIPNLTAGNTDDPISTGYGSRLAADAAIEAEFYITKRFSVQPQLEYSSQGGKKNGTQAFAVPSEIAHQFPSGQVPDYLYATYKSEARMNYLMLPILAKYHFDLKNRFGAYVAAGPFVSYLLNARNITKGSSMIYLDKAEKQPLTAEPQSFDSEDNITDNLHQFNGGISGQVGIMYSLSKSSFFLEAGGNYGLIDIQKDAADGKNKTGAFVVNIGYKLKIWN